MVLVLVIDVITYTPQSVSLVQAVGIKASFSRSTGFIFLQLLGSPVKRALKNSSLQKAWRSRSCFFLIEELEPKKKCPMLAPQT